jgi:pimeloyl-ACP methyl ester carboxylesterase
MIWLKWALVILGLALTLLALGVIALIVIYWTPDTDPIKMRAKYGAGSAFAPVSAEYAIHYRDEGCRECPALLLIHGLNASLQTWEPLAQRLGDRYRIISLDLPGHGLTGPHPQRDYTQDSAEEAIAAVLAATGVREFAVAGSSLGGGVAWSYALDHPVEALFLLDPIGAPRAPSEEPPSLNIGFRLMSIPGVIDLMTFVTPRSIVRMSLEQSVSNQAVVTDRTIDRYWELLRYPGNRRAAIDRARTDHGPAEFDRLADLKIPTLVLWGEEDTLIPVERATFFQEKLPMGSLVVLDGIGHLPMEEAPDKTAVLIDTFLRQNVTAK